MQYTFDKCLIELTKNAEKKVGELKKYLTERIHSSAEDEKKKERERISKEKEREEKEKDKKRLREKRR